MKPPSPFLDTVPSVTDFTDLFAEDTGRVLPSDWLVIATDIMGSTRAIEAGRYKDVNTVGAASIVHLINACTPHTIAYQFGGDGSLVAVPSSCEQSVLLALSHLKEAARRAFQLELRIGVWKAGDFESREAPILVTKYRLDDEQSLFMFHGPGVALSDEWLKDAAPVESLGLPTVAVINPGLSNGLECRWNPIRSRNGIMLTGLLVPRNSADRSTLLTEAHVLISGHDTNGTRPTSIESLNAGFPPKHYTSEWKVRTAGMSRIRAASIYVATLLKLLCLLPLIKAFKGKIPYLQELVVRSDFQKYDGVYRFVRDVTIEQAEAIRVWCSGKQAAGQLNFGLHESQEALMTCLVFDPKNHIHFIDGGDGGYAVAAKELKGQLKIKNA